MVRDIGGNLLLYDGEDMKKKCYLYLLGMFVLFPFLSMGQVCNSIQERFPVHIVHRIHVIAKITPISEESQLKLGQYFVKQDSLASQILKQKGESKVLDSCYYTSIDELDKFISPLEFNEYKLLVSPKGVSRLRRIVQQREALGLTAQQVRGLIQESNYLEKTNINPELRKLEFSKADSILTQSEFLLYYKIENEKRIADVVNKWLVELKKSNLMSMDSVRLQKLLSNYEIQRQTLLNYWRDSGNKKKYQEIERKCEIQKPVCLKKLDIYKKLPSWSIVLSAIQNNILLSLNDKEINLLLEKFVEFQNVRGIKDGKKSEREMEYSLIKPILGIERVNKILIAKKMGQSQDNALKRMLELEQYGLVNALNKEVILKELVDYELKVGIAREWSKLETTKTNMFRISDLKDRMPSILYKLDEEKEKEAKKKKYARF